MRGPLNELPIELHEGDLVTRCIEWGDMALRYARVPAGTDLSPVLTGLPGNRCPSPHWGVVLEGELHLLHADGTEEVARAGDAYYWPAGHTAWMEQDAVFLEIGPVPAMRQFGDYVKAMISSA